MTRLRTGKRPLEWQVVIAGESRSENERAGFGGQRDDPEITHNSGKYQWEETRVSSLSLCKRPYMHLCFCSRLAGSKSKRLQSRTYQRRSHNTNLRLQPAQGINGIFLVMTLSPIIVRGDAFSSSHFFSTKQESNENSTVLS